MFFLSALDLGNHLREMIIRVFGAVIFKRFLKSGLIIQVGGSYYWGNGFCARNMQFRLSLLLSCKTTMVYQENCFSLLCLNLCVFDEGYIYCYILQEIDELMEAFEDVVSPDISVLVCGTLS